MTKEEQGQMPCSPREICFVPYVLPNTLGTFEQEEAAARIISFSQKIDRWVGVSWSKLVEMMQEDYAAYETVEDARKRNYAEAQRYAIALRSYRRKCALTLGIYALFAVKPTVPQTQDKNKGVPFTTGIFLFGPEHVVKGIYELIDRGMIRRVTQGEGENAIDVFFPTPTLVAAANAAR